MMGGIFGDFENFYGKMEVSHIILRSLVLRKVHWSRGIVIYAPDFEPTHYGSHK